MSIWMLIWLYSKMDNKCIYINCTFLCSKGLTGIARFAIELSIGLKERLGDRVIFIAPRNVDHSDIVKKLNIQRVGVNTNRVVWEQIDLPLYLRKRGSPLLVSFGNTAPLTYKNQIVSILDLFYNRADKIFIDKKNAYSILATQFFKITIPIIARRAKIILTISKFSKDDIVNLFKIDPNKIEIVYPSISSKFIKSDNTDLPNKYGKYILGVSAITPRKNFEGLIRAYIQAGFKDVKLVIVGGSEESTKNYTLYNLYKDNPNILFTGYVSDKELVSLYKNSLFFAYPSFWEGFGIPPLEAMACGCPTLVSNVTSLPEVCGDASLYVDPYSIDSIRTGMERLVKDKNLRQKLISKGNTQILKYSRSDSLKKIISAIDDCVII